MEYDINEMVVSVDTLGWRFYSCDASIVGRYSVLLMRDTEGTKLWHTLSEELQEATELYASGIGRCLGESLHKAIIAATHAGCFDDWHKGQEKLSPDQ